MEPKPERPERKTLIPVLMEPSLIDDADRVVARHFDSRADMIRTSMRELIRRIDAGEFVTNDTDLRVA